MNRFERQHFLPGFGTTAQQKLQASSILIIGAGGLGCPAIQYLAAAGVGRIGIVDGDTVSISNLNRQILFGQDDIGKNKAITTQSALKKKYDDIAIEAYPNFISKENCLEIIKMYDIILDGSDNFPTRYLVNDACVLMKKPLVFGAIYQNEGQVAIFNTKDEQSVDYRDLYPTPPSALEVPNCNETGVLGVLPGIIGTLMASECIKFLTGYGETLADSILFYNLLSNKTYQVKLSKNPQAESYRPENVSAFQDIDYRDFCGLDQEAEWNEVINSLANNDQVVLIDIRAKSEFPKLEDLTHLKIEMDALEGSRQQLSKYQHIFLMCQTGKRSLKASIFLQRIFPDKYVQSVKGGLNEWVEKRESTKYNVPSTK
ncbi:HesA/MoeB/ThiF family protein [Belliella sp. DSM 111904]|uniref:HesA/MoeB/ThiF family protein n=1 Tax=Belliella filtrata TaxID=2923435 RepID=A0ABS9V148_9BACT|nr:HesA/MoeB/ThiF family protein [Belliella filtrata]MCH7410074.1 HesA/MoeB/ThiF family protein [Belliella filtrata]